MVQPEECLMYFVTVQSTAVTKLFETLKDILHDVNLVCTPEGISILTFDGSRVALVYLTLPAQNFEEYKCPNKLELGVNMTAVWKLAKQAGLHHTFSMFVRQDRSETLYIVISDKDSGDDTEYQLDLMDIDSEDMHIPNIPFDSVITMPAAYLQKLMRAMNDLGDDVAITYHDVQLIMECKGDSIKQITKINGRNHQNISMQSENNVRFQAEFPLRFLVLFSKAQGLCTTMEM